MIGCTTTEKSKNQVAKPSLDSLVNVFINEHKIPSIAIGIIKDNEVVLETAYGFANLEEKIPADENTLYQIGSITKVFTGRVLAHLIDDQQIALTDTLAHFFTDTKFPSSPSGQAATIKDVATHSGEFPTYPANLKRVDPDPIKGFTKEELKEGIEMMMMDTDFGVQFYYSNFGYGVLATAMENRTEQSLGELMEQYILKPYGMENTSVTMNDNIKGKLAIPYLNTSPILRTQPWEMGSLAGAGNMFSSVSDLNRLLLTLLSDNAINRIQQDKHFNIHDNWHYGLGCFVVDSEKWNTTYMFHGSDIDGYAGNLAFYPKYNFGYVILTNWGEGDAVREAITAIDRAISSFYLELGQSEN